MDNELDALDRSIVGKPTYEELSLELAWALDKIRLLEETIPKLKDLKDADDKQWYIECETLAIERLKAEAIIANAGAEKAKAAVDLQDANNTELRIRLENQNQTTIEVSCSTCGSNFEYSGCDAEEATACYREFANAHYSCQ